MFYDLGFDAHLVLNYSTEFANANTQFLEGPVGVRSKGTMKNLNPPTPSLRRKGEQVVNYLFPHMRGIGEK